MFKTLIQKRQYRTKHKWEMKTDIENYQRLCGLCACRDTLVAHGDLTNPQVLGKLTQYESEIERMINNTFR